MFWEKIKKKIQNDVEVAISIDNLISNYGNDNYDINAEIARDNYRLYQKELVQREQDYIEKWCEQIKTASREGKKFIYTNSFLVLGDTALVCSDDGCAYGYSFNFSIEKLKEYFEVRGFDVFIEENNDWYRLMIRWID